jgi:hypothetical protein
MAAVVKKHTSKLEREVAAWKAAAERHAAAPAASRRG